VSRPLVLVTGAAGFIGRAVRQRLQHDYRLVSVDVRPTPPLETPAEERCLQVDLGEPTALAAFWQSLSGEYAQLHGIIHLAAYYDFLDRPHTNYRRLLEALRTWLPWVARDVPHEAVWVQASSMAALESTAPGVKMTAHSPKHAGWQYPASKVEAERLLAEARLPQAVVELVLAAVYSDAGELVPLFQLIERVRGWSPEKYFLPAPADRGMTYVHVEEVADAFARAVAVFHGRGGSHRFLIGQEAPVTYRTLHQRAAQVLLGHRIPLLRIPRFVARLGAWVLAKLARLVRRRRFILPWMIAYAGEHFEFELTETRRELGWSPWRSMQQDLERILQFARADGPRWPAFNRARPR